MISPPKKLADQITAWVAWPTAAAQALMWQGAVRTRCRSSVRIVLRHLDGISGPNLLLFPGHEYQQLLGT
ncbi:hypothetical protein DIPPA_10972 [Diplonema papillatum]|nr:hypothetical protein DIPPA_10972 [Diplonema papillatum]